MPPLPSFDFFGRVFHKYSGPTGPRSDIVAHIRLLGKVSGFRAGEEDFLPLDECKELCDYCNVSYKTARPGSEAIRSGGKDAINPAMMNTKLQFKKALRVNRGDAQSNAPRPGRTGIIFATYGQRGVGQIGTVSRREAISGNSKAPNSDGAGRFVRLCPLMPAYARLCPGGGAPGSSEYGTLTLLKTCQQRKENGNLKKTHFNLRDWLH
jgi:hypothetical protein